MQGVATAGNDGFSLSSGDFPTLGSEKDESGKNTEALGSSCLLGTNLLYPLWI